MLLSVPITDVGLRIPDFQQSDRFPLKAVRWGIILKANGQWAPAEPVEASKELLSELVGLAGLEECYGCKLKCSEFEKCQSPGCVSYFMCIIQF